MDRAARGQWSETVAMTYLISEGYEVYVGFGNTSCDLVGIKDGQTYRVEVKTASKSRIPGQWVVSGVHPERFDILLVVNPETGDVLEAEDMHKVYLGK